MGDRRHEGESRWPWVVLAVTLVGVTVFVIWMVIQVGQVRSSLVDVAQVTTTAASTASTAGPTTTAVATTTRTPAPATTVATTTTSQPTTTTTTFAVGGLGPPCMPSACDLDVVAVVDRGDYIHNGKRGVLGWLLDYTQPSHVMSNVRTLPALEFSITAGVSSLYQVINPGAPEEEPVATMIPGCIVPEVTA